MSKLKLPRLRTAPPETLPPPAAPIAVAGATIVVIGRRQFLTALGVALAAAALPVTFAARAWASARGRFLTAHEFATLEALVDRVLPPDEVPGARALGAARYIRRLLTAFDRRRPEIFARGPFSGRAPQPDNTTGEPSKRRPRNGFKRFVPLTRLQELRWRAELFGSQAVPEVAALDAQHGRPLIGLRTLYRDGLAFVDRKAVALEGATFTALSSAAQDRVLAAVDADPSAPRDPRRGMSFVDLLIKHTIEGCFGPPEYGGNRRAAGWAMLGLEGDNQPLGYSIFSTALGDYRERPDHPMTTPNPDEIGLDGTLSPRPLSPDGARIQDGIATLANLLPDAC